MIRWWILAAVSAGLVALSWRSLRRPESHGFYRFFAFEAIAAIVTINIDRWFTDPFSALQIPSWLLLLLSMFLAVHGFRLLRGLGHPDGAIENTRALVQQGAYRYIRHPLYTSLLALAWGAALKSPSPAALTLAGIGTGALTLTARAEERECLRKFGGEYHAYMRRTRRFIPFLY